MNIPTRIIRRALIAGALAVVFLAPGPGFAQDGPGRAVEWQTLSQLGTAAFGANQLDDADTHFRAALAIAEAEFEPSDPRHIGSLINLSQSEKGRGNLSPALDLMERAVAIQEEFLGPDHEYLMGSLALLATLYAQLDRPGEAEPLYRRVLQLRRDLLGDYHPQTVGVVQEFAPVLEALGNVAGAETMYQEAVLSWSQVLGVHGRVVAAIEDYGKFLRRQGRLEEAAQADAAADTVRARVQAILDGGG